MPTYEYRCKDCGADFEIVQSFSDASLEVCPVVGGPAACTNPGAGRVAKVFGNIGITFKGSGFYKTDSRSNGSKSSSGSKADTAASSESSSKSDSTKADTKSSSSSDSGSSSGSSSGTSSGSGTTPSSTG